MEFRPLTESVADWLRYIKNSNEPINWIAPYESNLLSLLRHALARENEFSKAYELLTVVFPYFALSLSHIELWSPLLMDALLMAQDIKDNELQVKVFRWMGEAYLKVGKHESARRAFATGLERAETGQIDDMVVAIFIGIFKLQWFDLKQNVTRVLVDQALDTAKRVEDLKLRADLYDALAFAYARLRETKLALGYGQTAYGFWNSLQDHSGLGRAAYTLAVTYTQMTQIAEDKHFLEFAIHFLEIAHDELSQTDDVWQYPLLAYERALIHYQLEDYETAASWFQQSLQEAEGMNAPHYLVIGRHGLGLAQAKLSQYGSARLHLRAALENWDELKNTYEKANVLVGLADLEYNAGDVVLSQRYVMEGLQTIKEIQDVDMRQFLRNQFQTIVDKLAF